MKGYEELNRSLQSELEKVKVQQQMKARGSPGQPPASPHNGDLVREVQRLRGARDGRGARGGRGGGNTSDSLQQHHQQNQLQLLQRDIEEKEADVIRYRERCHRAEAENEELTEKLALERSKYDEENEELTEKLALERSKYDEEKRKLEEQLKGYEELNRSLQSEVKVRQQMRACGSPGQPPASPHNGDLVREVQRLRAEVKEKEFANTKMSRQVDATAAELKRVTAYSKVQSQKLLAMKTSAQVYYTHSCMYMYVCLFDLACFFLSSFFISHVYTHACTMYIKYIYYTHVATRVSITLCWNVFLVPVHVHVRRVQRTFQAHNYNNSCLSM